VRVDTVQRPTIHGAIDYEVAKKRVVETWKVCAKKAGERGLYVTWEVEPGFAFNKPSDVLRILDVIPDDNFGVMYDTCHNQMVAVVGARQHGAKETLPGGQLEFIDKLSGRINHIYLIDSDNSCHKDAAGNDETSAHAPFGEGVIDFDALVPRLAEERLCHDWWTIDLCFWANAWEQTEKCKKAPDKLNRKYGDSVGCCYASAASRFLAWQRPAPYVRVTCYGHPYEDYHRDQRCPARGRQARCDRAEHHVADDRRGGVTALPRDDRGGAQGRSTLAALHLSRTRSAAGDQRERLVDDPRAGL
jgi:Xylose isomerase-like TIM barrel